MRGAVGHAVVDPGVVAHGGIFCDRMENGRRDGAITRKEMGAGETQDGDGLGYVAELGHVLQDLGDAEGADCFDLTSVTHTRRQRERG